MLLYASKNHLLLEVISDQAQSDRNRMLLQAAWWRAVPRRRFCAVTVPARRRERVRRPTRCRARSQPRTDSGRVARSERLARRTDQHVPLERG